jgi:hypothetical protein
MTAAFVARQGHVKSLSKGCGPTAASYLERHLSCGHRPACTGTRTRLQVSREGKETGKLLKATAQALTEFEEASLAWQTSSSILDAALRGMGDVEHLFHVLQSDARALSQRIVALTSRDSSPKQAVVVDQLASSGSEHRSSCS